MANGTLAASQIEMLSQSGTGIVTIVPPTTNTNRTLTLPDSTGTLLNTNGGTITGTLTVTGVTTLGNGAVLGVPASGTATNLTGLPLTTGVTGTLPTANGGTALTSFTSGGVVYASSASVLATSSNLTHNGTTLTLKNGYYEAYDPADSTSAGYGMRFYTDGGGTKTENGRLAVSQTATSGSLSSMIFQTNNGTSLSEQMRLTSTGLGIGTSSPRTKFDVLLSGTANSGGSLAPSFGLFTGPGLAPITDGSRAGANMNIESNTAQGADVGASLMFGGRYVDSSTVSTGFGAIFGAKANGTSNELSGYLALYTNRASVMTEAMRITSAGDVGIGTTLPGAKLQVDSGDIRLQGNAPGKILFFSIGNGVSQNATLEVQNDGGTTNTGEFRFSTRNVATTLAERVRITAEGHLGIGTSSPAGKLSVIGGGVAGVTTYLGGTVDDGLMLGYVPSTGLAEIIGVNHAFSTYNDIGLRAGGNAQLYLSTGGNVGIGTTITAVAKVNVQLAGTVISGSTTGVTMGAGAIFQLNNSNAGATNSTVMLLAGGTGDTTVGQISSGIGFSREDENTWGTQLRFYTHNSATDVLSTLNEQMRITSGGNVGIGTTSPYTALQVSGTIKIAPSNTTGVLAFGGNVQEATQLGIFRGAANSTSGGNFLNMAGYEGLTFSVSAADIGSQTERMRITSAGNVGIGTTAPDSKLHVEAADGAVGGAIRYTATSVASVYMSADPNGLCLATDTAGITFRTGVTGNDPTDTGSERARIDVNGNLLVGTTDVATSASPGAGVSGGNFRSIRNTTTIPGLTTGTVLTLSSSVSGVYIVQANFGPQSNEIYGGMLIVVANNGSFRIVTNGGGASSVLTLSGANVQMANAVGSTLDAYASAVLIAN